MNKHVKKALQFITRSYTFIYGIGRPLKKKILFTSFNGKQYSDNPRAISEKFHELYPDWELVWFIKDKSDSYSVIPDYVRVIDGKFIGRLRMYKELATSFCYVRNVEYEPDVRKRKGQFFIQTWHGDRSFKKVLWESEPNKKYSFIDSKVVDLALSGSSFGTDAYRLALRYYGDVLDKGCPRNDCLINVDEKRVATIKQRLNITDEKILLYAPTYKDELTNKESLYVDLLQLQKTLTLKNGGKWIILIRSHLASKGIDYADSLDIRDVSDYPDMSDLLCITDMLLSDYSSCICDFALTGKPCILVPFDLEDYVEKSRELKVYPTECGLPVAQNQQELEDIVVSKSLEEYADFDNNTCAFYGTSESGKSSELVCKTIVNKYLSQIS